MASKMGVVMENLRDPNWDKHWKKYLDIRETPPMEASDVVGLGELEVHTLGDTLGSDGGAEIS